MFCALPRPLHLFPMWHLLGHVGSAHDRLLTSAPIVLKQVWQVERLGEVWEGAWIRFDVHCS